MADYFTVRTREEFNTRLWTRAAVDRQYNYKQPARQAKRAVSAEKGEPPGENSGKKNYHLNFVQQWWCFEEVLAEAECRPLNYTLIHEPPAPDSGQIQQANGAKLLAFYRHILELFDADDQSVPGVNTQTDKTMLGFFEDLLAAQFADCPKDLQGYATIDAADKDVIKAVAKRINMKVRERITRRDAYSETLGAALTEQDMLKYYNMTVKQMKGYN
ncbi:g2372 [Coccomyxa elongata]